MKAKTKKWLPFVKADLETARVMLRQKNRNRWTNILILFHCQQAIEKLFKAIIVEKGKELLKIHDLGRLREMADVALDSGQQKFILQLSKFYFTSRYPDLVYKAMPSKNDRETESVYQKTNTLSLWLTQYLERL